MREDPDRPTGLVSVAAGAAVLVALLGLLPVVQGAGWWFESVLFVVVVIAVVVGGRRAGLPAPAAAIVAVAAVPVLALLAVVGPAAAADPGTSALAVIESLDRAFRQIYVDAVPANGTPELALVIACGAALVAIVVDLVAVGLRAPLAGTLVVLAVAIVPGKAFGTGTNGLLLVAVAAAALALVAADRRRRGAAPRVAGLAAGGAVAVVVALVAQVVLPAPSSSQAQPLSAPLFGSNADPLLRLGQDLRRGATTPVLSYTTQGSQALYLRLAVLEDFSGTTWRPNPAEGGALAFGEPPAAPGLARDEVQGYSTTTIDPASPLSIGDRLPLPYPATDVSGVRSRFRWEERGLTLARVDSGEVGRYTTTSAVVDTSAAALRRASVSTPVGDEESRALPRGVPQVIRTTAARWTRGADTPYAVALAIQNRLRNGSFSYDESTPAEQGYDGDGLGVIAQFLRVQAGYCIHYASTMAVMARIEGIPSRVVVGYQPGEPSAGTRARSVTSDDLHAWPELYFDGIGWVRFEPTPGRGSVPSYAPLPSAAATSTPSAAAPSAAVPTPTPTAGAASSGRNGGDLAALAGTVARVAGVALIVLLVLAVPLAVRLLRRRRRLARGGPGAAARAWEELVDSVHDLGLATGDGGSPRTQALAIATHVGGSPAARAALDRLRGAFERQAYSPASGSAEPEDVRTVVAAVTGRLGRTPRILALVAPRSLLRRRPVATIRTSRLAFRWSPPGSG